MGLVEPARRPAVLDNLAKDLQAKGPTAGKSACDHPAALPGRRRAQSDLIYSTFNTDTQGYGLQVKLGKTSLCEGWNGGTSQDHFMFGQINEWFSHDLAGIQDDPDGPGFQKIVIKPAVVGDLTWAEASYDSLHGMIGSAWKRAGDKVTLHVTIPPNTTATVYVPTDDALSITEAGRPAAQAVGVKFLRMAGQAAVCQIGSGDYRFAAHLPAGPGK